MKHLYFIRHGQSVMNKRGVFAGRAETPLNNVGRTQAEVAGQSLRTIPIDLIVTSPMGRTIETASIIADIINYPREHIISSPLFTERDFGPLEGTTYKPDLGDIKGVEQIADLLGRADQGLAFLQSLPDDNILLVSHGAIGRALRHSINPDIPFSPSEGFKNGEVIQLI